MIAQQVYDPRGMTWNYWCAKMSEAFAANQLGTVTEDNWAQWADALAGIGRFAGAPSSQGFPSWQDWAFALNNTIRN